jgi:hypothetical protein
VPHDIFVSYSQPDRDCAFELTSRLEARSLRVWIAPRDVSPSADWAAEIIDAIAAARLMVLVFSAHSNASPQVRREVERAVHRQVPVLPFRIEEVLPSKSLEYFLSSQHWLDAFPPPLETHYARLCAHLSAKLRGAPVADIKDTGRSRILDPALALSLTAAELQFLERHLAYHVGPVAGLLLKRALASAIDRDQLTTQLASELDSEPARRQFVNTCRSLLKQTGRSS